MNLVVASLIDGRIDPAEAWVLRSAARMLDIDDRSAEFWAEMVTRAPKLSLKVPEGKEYRELCMDLMIAACKADGVVRPEEMRMLKQVAPNFGVSPGWLVRKMNAVTIETVEQGFGDKPQSRAASAGRKRAKPPAKASTRRKSSRRKKRSRRKFGTWRNPWVHTEYARPPECSEEELQRRYDNMTDNTYVNQHVSKVEHRRGKEITHY